jgi:hypothetical protein
MSLESLIHDLIQLLPLLRVRVELLVNLSLSGQTSLKPAKRSRKKADRMM